MTNSDVLKLLDAILDNAQTIRIMQVQCLANDTTKYKQTYEQSTDTAWKRLNDAHEQLYTLFAPQQKYDISDAFVLCHHNKIKATLANGTELIIERIPTDTNAEGYGYTLNIKYPDNLHYGGLSYTAWSALSDVLRSPFQISPQDTIWLPIERC